MKICNTCKLPRKSKDFRVMKNADSKTGYYVNKRCYFCEREWLAAHRRKPETKKRKKFYWIAFRYGLTPEQWQIMLKQQQGKCAICKKRLLRPFTDHNHKTGKVRGLLCGPCNMYLGHVKEQVEVYKRAIRYLCNTY